MLSDREFRFHMPLRRRIDLIGGAVVAIGLGLLLAWYLGLFWWLEWVGALFALVPVAIAAHNGIILARELWIEREGEVAITAPGISLRVHPRKDWSFLWGQVSELRVWTVRPFQLSRQGGMEVRAGNSRCGFPRWSEEPEVLVDEIRARAGLSRRRWMWGGVRYVRPDE